MSKTDETLCGHPIDRIPERVLLLRALVQFLATLLRQREEPDDE